MLQCRTLFGGPRQVPSPPRAVCCTFLDVAGVYTVVGGVCVERSSPNRQCALLYRVIRPGISRINTRVLPFLF
jgi:hypothetical protein